MFIVDAGQQYVTHYASLSQASQGQFTQAGIPHIKVVKHSCLYAQSVSTNAYTKALMGNLSIIGMLLMVYLGIGCLDSWSSGNKEKVTLNP